MFADERAISRALFMVIIATFNDSGNAKHLRDRLIESGVRADINSEGHLQQVAAGAAAKANIKLSVADDDFAKAQKLLVEWETTDPDLAFAIRCPQCKSSRIQYPQLTRKFLTPALMGILLALKIFPKEFYCEDCHFTWSDQAEQPTGRLWSTLFAGRDPAE